MMGMIMESSLYTLVPLHFAARSKCHNLRMTQLLLCRHFGGRQAARGDAAAATNFVAVVAVHPCASLRRMPAVQRFMFLQHRYTIAARGRRGFVPVSHAHPDPGAVCSSTPEFSVGFVMV